MRQLTFQRVLGSGAFGSVYLAELYGRRGFRRPVAVKVLLENHPDGDVFVARVRDEARLLGLLQDEHILKVLELVRVQGRDAVMMEYVEGVDLAAAISGVEPPPPRALAELGAAVAGALHAAHTAKHPSTGEPLNVVHRDVKPANVMITDRGGVKLLDFGVAQARFAARESKTGQFVLGTLNYMAPEYIITGEVRPAADIYGLALALWEVAAGEVFGQPKLKAEAHAKRVEERLQQVSSTHAELVPVLRQMLLWDPTQRPNGQSVERQLTSAADLLRGTGLRSWATVVVPKALEKVRRTASDSIGLVGQVINIADEDAPVLNVLSHSGGKPPAEALPDEATLWGAKRPDFIDQPSAAPRLLPSPGVSVSPPTLAPPARGAAPQAPPPYVAPTGFPPPYLVPAGSPPATAASGASPPPLAHLGASRSVIPGSTPQFAPSAGPAQGGQASAASIRPAPVPSAGPLAASPSPSRPAPVPVVGRESIASVPSPVQPRPAAAGVAPKPQKKSNIGWIVLQGLVAGGLVGMFLVITAVVIFVLAVGFG